MKTSEINIKITKNPDTLEMKIECNINGNKIDIAEAFIKVVQDEKKNDLQEIINAVIEYS